MTNIIKNPNFESQMDGWQIQDSAKIEFSPKSDGTFTCLVTNRNVRHASIAQDITQQVRAWGCGDYMMSATVKPNGTTIGNFTVAISAKIDGHMKWFTSSASVWDANYSTVEGVNNLCWRESIENVLIYLIAGQDLFDYYCTNITVEKLDGKMGTTFDDYLNSIPKRELAPWRNDRTAIGSIRWDAWINKNVSWGDDKTLTIGAQMVRNLSPTQYHFRMPYFGKVIDKDTIELPDYTQEIFDQEQLYAHEAGIDYWCYCWYDGAMAAARKFHATSKYRNLVKMSRMINERDMLDANEIIEHLKMGFWQMADNNRPLFFVHAMGGNPPKKESVEAFRKTIQSAGYGNPYILGMTTFGISTTIIRNTGMDGVSAYAVSLGNCSPYSELAKRAATYWDDYKASGVDVVPCVTTGWDRRPRIDNPVSWEGITNDKNDWTETATPQEIAEHLKSALEWNAANSIHTPFNSVMIYAWNEHDEGGWLCPTIIDDERDGLSELNYDGTNKPDTRRLEAIQQVLKPNSSWNPQKI